MPVEVVSLNLRVKFLVFLFLVSSIGLFPRLIFYIVILSDVVDFLDNVTHQHLLGDEADEDAAKEKEELLEASQVSQEREDVRHLPRVDIVILIYPDEQRDKFTFLWSVVILVGFNVEHLVELLFVAIQTLYLVDVVVEHSLLVLDVHVRALYLPRVNRKEQLVIDEGSKRILEVILDEHCVDKREAEILISKELVDLRLFCANRSLWRYTNILRVQFLRVVLTFPHFDLQIVEQFSI